MATSGAERRAERELVSAYHESSLAALVDRLTDALEQYRTKAIGADQADRIVYQYHRAAQELWKFCWATDVDTAAHTLQAWTQPIDWWQRGAPHERR
jgi:hypothetical protein